MDEIVQDEEMSDIPQNVLSVNLNDINSNVNMHINEDFSENIHSENMDLNDDENANNQN